MDAATKSSMCPKHATCNPPSCQQRTCTARRGSFPRVSRSAGGPILPLVPSESKRPNCPPPPTQAMPPTTQGTRSRHRLMPRVAPRLLIQLGEPRVGVGQTRPWGLEGVWRDGALKKHLVLVKKCKRSSKLPPHLATTARLATPKSGAPSDPNGRPLEPSPASLAKTSPSKHRNILSRRDTIHHSRCSSPPIPTIRSSAAVLTRSGTPPSKEKRPTPGPSGPLSKFPSRSGSGTMHDCTHPFLGFRDSARHQPQANRRLPPWDPGPSCGGDQPA